MSNIGNRYRYQLGGYSPLQQGLGSLGSFVTQLDSDLPGQTIGGALTGASYGMALGPVGAVGGAIIGGISGAINGKKQQEERKRQQEEMNERNIQSIRQQSKSVLQSYPSQGVEMAGYYENGGIPTWLTNSLAEDEEVMVGDRPATDSNGTTTKLASNVSQFKGDTHQAPSGGIGFNGQGLIYSDKLKTPDGLTFAQEAEVLGKRKGKFEKQLENATTSAEYNTAQRMIQRINNELEQLFNQQESLKNGI